MTRSAPEIAEISDDGDGAGAAIAIVGPAIVEVSDDADDDGADAASASVGGGGGRREGGGGRGGDGGGGPSGGVGNQAGLMQHCVGSLTPCNIASGRVPA